MPSGLTLGFAMQLVTTTATSTTNTNICCGRCILEASYELHDSAFYENLGTVLLYAVVVSQ